jgi:hypothetical protein
MGGVDLQQDLATDGGHLATLYARSHLVVCSRAARIGPPIDAADGVARRLPDGEFVDLPVAQRAERLLARA